jgi:hypothetical protein
MYENDKRCNKTFYLYNMQFRDPNYVNELILVDLCKGHYEEVIKITTERITELKRNISHLITDAARLRLVAKEYDVYIGRAAIFQKIEDAKLLVRKLEVTECRNIFCRENLDKLEAKTKIYSCTSWKPSGKKHVTLYFCSLKCMNIMKAMCGINANLLKKQMTLEMI